jgi:hypothetical protein
LSRHAAKIAVGGYSEQPIVFKAVKKARKEINREFAICHLWRILFLP